MTIIDDWYLEKLRCPRDMTKLNLVGNDLVSESGNTYPIVNGIPIMLVDNVPQTIDLANISLADSHLKNDSDPYFINTLGISEYEKQSVKKYTQILQVQEGIINTPIDPIIQFLIGATNGILYSQNIGNLKRLPIPDINLPVATEKQLLLDIGCSWGRWCISGTYKKYQCVGIDPSLGAVLAGKRTADKLGLDIKFVVGDARYLPFNLCQFDQVFSYSVIQHFSKSDAQLAIQEISRVLKPNGNSLIQMPNRLGIRSLQHQIKRGFAEGENFDVRYWGVGELLSCFGNYIGKSELLIDGFFGLGIQKSDVDLLPLKYKLVVLASETLKTISFLLPFLKYFADSLYIKSCKDKSSS
jgi:SAM-dependent methyltransferase